MVRTQPHDHRREPLTEELASAGFLAAREEAEQLVAFAGDDGTVLAHAVERRLTGEPLAWITSSTVFCGHRINVEPGVYVPRGFSGRLARRAVDLLPAAGSAIDLCTGTGAIARTLMLAQPEARIVATDLDPTAVACARTNGVDAVVGDLFDGLPEDLGRSVDVVIGVVPYVPADELIRLQRDTFAFESRLAYDGGEGGLTVLRRVIAEAPRFLRAGGTLLLEVGGDQDQALRHDLERNGYQDATVFVDDDGDTRGIEARRTFDAPELIETFTDMERRLASPTGNTRATQRQRRAPSRVGSAAWVDLRR